MSLSGKNMNTSDAPQTDCTFDRCYPLIFLISYKRRKSGDKGERFASPVAFCQLRLLYSNLDKLKYKHHEQSFLVIFSNTSI